MHLASPLDEKRHPPSAAFGAHRFTFYVTSRHQSHKTVIRDTGVMAPPRKSAPSSQPPRPPTRGS